MRKQPPAGLRRLTKEGFAGQRLGQTLELIGSLQEGIARFGRAQRTGQASHRHSALPIEISAIVEFGALSHGRAFALESRRDNSQDPVPFHKKVRRPCDWPAAAGTNSTSRRTNHALSAALSARGAIENARELWTLCAFRLCISSNLLAGYALSDLLWRD